MLTVSLQPNTDLEEQGWNSLKGTYSLTGEQIESLKTLVNPVVSIQRIEALLQRNKSVEEIAQITSVDLAKSACQSLATSFKWQLSVSLALLATSFYLFYRFSAATQALDVASNDYDSSSPVKPNELTSLIFSDLCDAYGDTYTESTCSDMIDQTQQSFTFKYLAAWFVTLGVIHLFITALQADSKILSNYLFPKRQATQNQYQPIKKNDNALQDNLLTSDAVKTLTYRDISDLVWPWWGISLLIFVIDWGIPSAIICLAAIFELGNHFVANQIRPLFLDFCVAPYATTPSNVNGTGFNALWNECRLDGHYNLTVPETIGSYCADICDNYAQPHIPGPIYHPILLPITIVAFIPYVFMMVLFFCGLNCLNNSTTCGVSHVRSRFSLFLDNFSPEILQSGQSAENDDRVIAMLASR